MNGVVDDFSVAADVGTFRLQIAYLWRGWGGVLDHYGRDRWASLSIKVLNSCPPELMQRSSRSNRDFSTASLQVGEEIASLTWERAFWCSVSLQNLPESNARDDQCWWLLQGQDRYCTTIDLLETLPIQILSTWHGRSLLAMGDDNFQFHNHTLTLSVCLRMLNWDGSKYDRWDLCQYSG